MRKWLVPVASLWSLCAAANPRILTAAAGDCDDADLRTASRMFAESIKSKMKDQALDNEVASQQLKPRSTKSREEIQRQLASAQTQFYNLQYFKANVQVEDALKDIEALTPGPDRWSLFIGAQLLRGMVKLGAKQNQQAEEAFRKVLRLDPNHQLDPDYYSPSTRTEFDKVRKIVQAEPRANLQVRSNPPGAEVFLDGNPVGKTPLNAKYLPGKYHVVLGRSGVFSFPRILSVGETSSLHVDLDFEGAVRGGQPVCIAEPKLPPADRLGNAVKLGAMVGVEEIVIIRVRRQSPGATWLTANLVNVRGGNEVREGGLKLDVQGPASQVDDLVNFITTGQASPSVVVGKSTASPWAAGEAKAEPARPSQPPPPPPPNSTPNVASNQPTTDTATATEPSTATSSVSTSGSSGRWRSKAWIPAVAGGTLFVAGAIFYIGAKGTESALASRNPDITNPDGAVSKGRTLQTVGIICAAAGVVGLGVAGAFYLFDKPSSSVALVPTGSGMAVTGTW